MFLLNTIYRLVVVSLCIVALFMTFHTFSGVQAASIGKWIVERENEPLQVMEQVKKETTLQVKATLKKEPTIEAMSIQHEHAYSYMEEKVDLSEYARETVLATGYTAGYESTGKTPDHPAYGITFSGVPVQRGYYSTIAADPTVYPIGTILFIPGYGYGVVADTGSAIKGHKIDLYYESVDDVYNEWGKKEVDIYVIKKGTGTLTNDDVAKLNGV